MSWKLVSGGQTGVDRAALDVAHQLGWARGGWCPKGRWAEDGNIPDTYPLRETPDADPAQRTQWNVRDADATLILLRGDPRGGTQTTLAAVQAMGRPYCLVDLDAELDMDAVREWLDAANVQVLNVAGPRESESPGIYAAASRFLSTLWESST